MTGMRGKKMTGFNRTYTQLIANFPPRPIASDKQFWATQDQIDTLLSKLHLTVDEQDYLTVLSMLIEQYEDEHEPEITLQGIRLIRALMDEQELYQRDLVKPVFKTDSIASAVLNGKRRLTVEHIDKLAAYFDLPHAWFFELPATDEGLAVSDEQKQSISPRPAKPHRPIVEFVNKMDMDMDMDSWRTKKTKKITPEEFCENSHRLRLKIKS